MIFWLHYFHTCECFSHISTILIYVFNSIVTRLSWHVLCYLISKNLYSLQSVQPFIFQLICMQLCKCLNCFLKSHNKQLNQYCLNFTIFLPKKNVLKNVLGSSHRLGRVRKFWPVLPCLNLTSGKNSTLGKNLLSK